MAAPIEILHEDAECLAVVKPAGQFTQGDWAPPGELTLEQAVRNYLGPEDPGAVYLGMVHRLDRPTSGVLIWARTPRAARRLSKEFEHRRVVKEYWALVDADADPTLSVVEETWCDWLTRPGTSGHAHVVDPGTPGARRALTRVRREAAGSVGLADGIAWLRLWPETGRTHQLRVQAGSRGWPILGDTEYGSTRPFEPPPNAIALHARSLTIAHPTTRTPLNLVAPIPMAWQRLGFDPEAGALRRG